MAASKSSLYDIRDIWAMAWKRRWLIVVPLLLVSVATYGASLLISPEYEASTILSISQEVHLSSDLQHLLGIEPSYRSQSRRRDQLRGIYNELTSSAYLKQLVQQLNLDQDRMLEQKAREMARLQPSVTVEEIKLDLIQSELRDKIDVNFAAEDQIRIAVQSTDPSKARDIANSLGNIYVVEKLKQELTSIRSSQDFSDLQLQKYQQILEEKISQRTRLERRQLQIRLDESITSESNRSEIHSEVGRTNREIEDLRNDEREILGSLSSVAGLSTNQLSLRESDRHKRLRSDLRSQLRDIDNQVNTYAWNDPQILNFMVRQNNTLRDIEEENKIQVGKQFTAFDEQTRTQLVRLFNVRSNLDYLYSKASYLSSSIEQLTDKMNLVPELQAQLNRLNEEIVTATDMRDRFKQQQASSSISQALLQDASVSKYRVVEPAKLPLEPFKPDRRKIALMGVFLGLIVGVGAAVIAELLDNSLKKIEEVEEYIGLPVLGITPKADFLKKIRA